MASTKVHPARPSNGLSRAQQRKQDKLDALAQKRKTQIDGARAQAEAAKRHLDAKAKITAREVVSFRLGELAGRGHKIDDALRRRVLNAVDAKGDRARQAGEAFDPLRAADGVLTKVGVVLARPNTSNLDQYLPPARPSGHAPHLVDPVQQAEHDARVAEHRSRGERLRAERDRQREAYQKRLRELGLTDPSLGHHGTGTSGLGH